MIRRFNRHHSFRVLYIKRNKHRNCSLKTLLFQLIMSIIVKYTQLHIKSETLVFQKFFKMLLLVFILVGFRICWFLYLLVLEIHKKHAQKVIDSLAIMCYTAFSSE